MNLKNYIASVPNYPKEGIIFRNHEGYLDMDYYKHAEIAHRINPNLNIWVNILSERS